MFRRRADVDRDAASRMQPQQRPRRPFGRFLDGRARAGGRARGGGSRMREVIVDLPAHPLDLLPDGRGHLGVARRRGRLGLLR